MDPFAALLREKAKAVLVQDAEPGVARVSASSSLSSRSTPRQPPLEDDDDERGDLENVVGEADTERLLGRDQGRAVGRILAGDKKGVGDVRKGDVLGVALWDDRLDEDGMDVDEGLRGLVPSLDVPSGHVVVDLLKSYADRHGETVGLLDLRARVLIV